jgi:hypothetical protein
MSRYSSNNGVIKDSPIPRIRVKSTSSIAENQVWEVRGSRTV